MCLIQNGVKNTAVIALHFVYNNIFIFVPNSLITRYSKSLIFVLEVFFFVWIISFNYIFCVWYIAEPLFIMYINFFFLVFKFFQNCFSASRCFRYTAFFICSVYSTYFRMQCHYLFRQRFSRYCLPLSLNFFFFHIWLVVYGMVRRFVFSMSSQGTIQNKFSDIVWHVNKFIFQKMAP